MSPRPRLILFDVDGTLISPGPASRAAFASALIDVFGTSGDLSNYAFEGKLDPVIVAELMREAGIEDAVVVTPVDLQLATRQHDDHPAGGPAGAGRRDGNGARFRAARARPGLVTPASTRGR
mgnify:CR=1 FL=1